MAPDYQARKRRREEGAGSSAGASSFEEGEQEQSSSKEVPNEEEDPFHWCLRCEDVPDTQQHTVIWWHSPVPPIKLDVEIALEPILVPFKKKERGMFKGQPQHRVHKLQRACHHHRIPMTTALSLRRHYMKRYNPGLRMSGLRLGSDQDVRQSARLFEQAVQRQLEQCRVEFYTEIYLKQYIEQHRRPDQPYPPTPDFILKRPVLIKTYFTPRGPRTGKKHEQQNRGGNDNRKVIQEQSIHWIEVKMFYGASNIEADGKSAVGCLLNTAQKYVRVYGPGAMVFMHGYGEGLAAALQAEGVLCLDCNSMVDLGPVEEHQRTWCADKHGNILP